MTIKKIGRLENNNKSIVLLLKLNVLTLIQYEMNLPVMYQYLPVKGTNKTTCYRSNIHMLESFHMKLHSEVIMLKTN